MSRCKKLSWFISLLCESTSSSSIWADSSQATSAEESFSFGHRRSPNAEESRYRETKARAIGFPLSREPEPGSASPRAKQSARDQGTLLGLLDSWNRKDQGRLPICCRQSRSRYTNPCVLGFFDQLFCEKWVRKICSNRLFFHFFFLILFQSSKISYLSCNKRKTTLILFCPQW